LGIISGRFDLAVVLVAATVIAISYDVKLQIHKPIDIESIDKMNTTGVLLVGFHTLSMLTRRIKRQRNRNEENRSALGLCELSLAEEEAKAKCATHISTVVNEDVVEKIREAQKS